MRRIRGRPAETSSWSAFGVYLAHDTGDTLVANLLAVLSEGRHHLRAPVAPPEARRVGVPVCGATEEIQRLARAPAKNLGMAERLSNVLDRSAGVGRRIGWEWPPRGAR